MATLSGVGTGLVGWPGLIADLPTLFMLSMRSIYQISLCYGFDHNGENGTAWEQAYETEYMMRVFKIATCSDKVQKQRALAELKDFEAGRDDEHAQDIGGDYAARQIGKNASSFISQRIIREIVEQTISKKSGCFSSRFRSSLFRWFQLCLSSRCRRCRLYDLSRTLFIR